MFQVHQKVRVGKSLSCLPRDFLLGGHATLIINFGECEGLNTPPCPPEALMPWVESAEPINMIRGSKKYGKKGVKSQTSPGTTAYRKRTSFPHKLCTIGSCMSYFEEKWFETSPLATYPEKEEVCRLNSLRSFDLGEIFRHLSEKYRSVKSSAGLPLCILTPGFCPLAPHRKNFMDQYLSSFVSSKQKHGITISWIYNIYWNYPPPSNSGK